MNTHTYLEEDVGIPAQQSDGPVNRFLVCSCKFLVYDCTCVHCACVCVCAGWMRGRVINHMHGHICTSREKKQENDGHRNLAHESTHATAPQILTLTTQT